MHEAVRSDVSSGMGSGVECARRISSNCCTVRASAALVFPLDHLLGYPVGCLVRGATWRGCAPGRALMCCAVCSGVSSVVCSLAYLKLWSGARSMLTCGTVPVLRSGTAPTGYLNVRSVEGAALYRARTEKIGLRALLSKRKVPVVVTPICPCRLGPRCER